MYTVFTEQLTTHGIVRKILFTTDDRNYANEWALDENYRKSDPNLFYCVVPTADVWFK